MPARISLALSLIALLLAAAPATAGAKTLVSYDKAGGIAGVHVGVTDGYSQTVRYAGRVVTVETEARPPARLRKVLTLLDALAG